MRDSFVFKKQWREGIESLPPKEQVEAYSAIMDYALDDIPYTGTNCAIKMLMAMISTELNDNKARYDEICEKRRRAANERWSNALASKSIQMDTNESKSMQVRYDSDIDIVFDSDIESDSVIDNEKGKKKRFIKPTKEEIENYCKQKGYHIDAQQFIDYYESVGWVIGKSGKKMKSWQSALSTWESRRSDKPKTPTIFETQESDWVKQRREQEERERKEFNQRMFEENKKRINAKK